MGTSSLKIGIWEKPEGPKRGEGKLSKGREAIWVIKQTAEKSGCFLTPGTRVRMGEKKRIKRKGARHLKKSEIEVEGKKKCPFTEGKDHRN